MGWAACNWHPAAQPLTLRRMTTLGELQLRLQTETARADLAEARAGAAEARADAAEARADAAERQAAAHLASLMFEISVLENYHDNYDGEDIPASEPALAVAAFLKHCRQYVDPNEVPQERTQFNWGANTVSYTDVSGRDKPKSVTLSGPLTEAMRASIDKGIRDLYFRQCHECEAEMPLSMWCLCESCRNL